MTKTRKTFLEDVAGAKSRDRWLAPISAKHRGRHEFSGLPAELRTVLPHCFASRNEQVAYIKNSKAGCTTIAQLIHKADYGAAYEGNIHQRPGLNRGLALSWRKLMDILETGYVFSVVRHPEARAKSGFFNFFVEGKNAEAEKHRPFAQSFGLYDGSDLSARFDGFLDYVAASLDANALKTDRHFRPQHINLGHGHVDLSFVGHLETLQADIATVGEQTGLKLVDGMTRRVPKKNATGSETFDITAKQRARLETIYARDYEIYGY